jgi:hypothetical protein
VAYCNHIYKCNKRYKVKSFRSLMVSVWSLCFTVTLIGTNEKGQGVSNDGSRHCNGAATNYNKGISFFLHRRIYLATLAVALLLMVVLISVTVHFSSRNEDDLPKHTFYPPPNGKIKYRCLDEHRIIFSFTYIAWLPLNCRNSCPLHPFYHSFSEMGKEMCCVAAAFGSIPRRKL